MDERNVNRMQRAVDCLNGELRSQYALSERLPGKSGAWLVDSPDGEQGILKVFDDDDCDVVEQTVDLVQHLCAVGYPTPRQLHHGPIPGGGCFYLQQRLPGHPMRSPGVWSELNQQELDLLLRVLDLHAGIALGTSQDWTCTVEEVALRQRGEWVTVAQSPLLAVQRLLEACAQRCAELGNLDWRHNDLVIGDFGPHNVLLDDRGQVAAVFDLDGAGRGDRVIDLVGLLYMVELELLNHVRHEALQIAHPAALTVCGVYWIVHRLYHGIRANDENLEFAAQQMLAHIDLLT